MLSTLGLEGAESFGEGGKTVVVVFSVVGSVVAKGLHVGAIPFVVGVLTDPEVFVDVPLDEGGIGMETGEFLEFLFEMASFGDDGERGFNQLVGVEGASGFGGEYLLRLNVEEVRLDGIRRVPFGVKVEVEVLDVVGGDGAITSIQIGEDIADRAIAKAALADGKGGLVVRGDGFI